VGKGIERVVEETRKEEVFLDGNRKGSAHWGIRKYTTAQSEGK